MLESTVHFLYRFFFLHAENICVFVIWFVCIFNFSVIHVGYLVLLIIGKKISRICFVLCYFLSVFNLSFSFFLLFMFIFFLFCLCRFLYLLCHTKIAILTKHKTNTLGLLFVLYSQILVVAIILFDFSALKSIQKSEYMPWIGLTVAGVDAIIWGKEINKYK
jgi:hypothetical protein